MRNKSILLRSSLLASPAILSGAYANTLTNLFGQLYEGLDVVSREMVGFIPSVTRNVGAERAAVGQAVIYPITPGLTTVNTTPSMTIPTPADVNVGNGNITITKSKNVEFGLTGEETRGLNNGVGALTVQADLFAQALRVLCNEIEIDLGTEASLNSSRATGTGNTTPFATSLADSANLRKILDDNGAPLTGRALIGDTSMGANLRSLANLTRVNESGTTMGLRDGELLNINGFSIKESVGVHNQTSGTAAGATTNAAGYPIGSTVINLAAAGTGTLLNGGYITFAGDTNRYCIASGDADVSNGGSITLQAPGLRRAIPAVATAISVTTTWVRNIGFSRDALHLVARAPALPETGDAAIDRQMIFDPRSGMAFEISLYAGYRMMRAEVACAWGVKAVKPAHIATLLG